MDRRSRRVNRPGGAGRATVGTWPSWLVDCTAETLVRTVCNNTSGPRQTCAFGHARPPAQHIWNTGAGHAARSSPPRNNGARPGETPGRHRERHAAPRDGGAALHPLSSPVPQGASRLPRPGSVHPWHCHTDTVQEVAVNSGDTAWVLASAALVLLMTPGLALFYGGMVRAKSVLNMMMMSFGALALISVLWVLYGYSEAFGNDVGAGLVGNPFEFFGLSKLMGTNGVDGGFQSNSLVFTIPSMAFVAFQAVFAIITVALISGAIA